MNSQMERGEVRVGGGGEKKETREKERVTGEMLNGKDKVIGDSLCREERGGGERRKEKRGVRGENGEEEKEEERKKTSFFGDCLAKDL